MDSTLLHKDSDEARRQLDQLEGAESSESESEGDEEEGEANKKEVHVHMLCILMCVSVCTCTCAYPSNHQTVMQHCAFGVLFGLLLYPWSMRCRDTVVVVCVYNIIL